MLKFSTFLSEGINDPAIFKAVFLAGGPGSGKSFIVGKTGLPALGMKVVNSDDAFEAAMKKAGKVMSPEEIFSDEGQEIRGKAKRLTGIKQTLYIKGRLGLVIDGTGKDFDKVKKQVKSLQNIGYDTAMIFVNTDLETAIKRDSERDRTIGEKGVTDYWKTVQKNIGAFQTMFGKQNMLIVDNSEGKDFKVETLRAYKDVTKFLKKPIENSLAKRWIKTQTKKKS
jgi:shikimate kinase|tara:strand:- start:11604 stop:12278 length:675 start_codon:yes stop_codon:yes gene_type:complete